MGRRVALFATVLMLEAALSHAALSPAEVYWRTVLPDTPMPAAILDLVRRSADMKPDGREPTGEIVIEPSPFGDGHNDPDHKHPKKESMTQERKPIITRAREPSPFHYNYEDTNQKHPRKDSMIQESKPILTGAREPSPFHYYYKDRDQEHPKNEAMTQERKPMLTRVREPSPFYYGYKDTDHKRPKKEAMTQQRKSMLTRAREPSPFDYNYKNSDQKGHQEETMANKLRNFVSFTDYKKYQAREPPAFGYSYKRSDQNEIKTGVTVQEREPEVNQVREPSPFHYDYRGADQKGLPSKATTTTTVFFLEDALHRGNNLTFYFPPATSKLALLPRDIAESLPFSTSKLAEILSMFSMAPDSVDAEDVSATLRSCESPSTTRETRFCATSLESMIELSMSALGTRDIKAESSALPEAGASLQQYAVRAVDEIQGSNFVACHDELYPYAVFRCHTTGPSRAYMVEMAGQNGAAVTVAAVCHTDTSWWNPKHVAFKLLKVKPGSAPVCHIMPYGHILWTRNEKRLSA